MYLSLLLAGVLADEVLYTLDTTWAPQFPVGGHTYSGVGVAKLKEGVTGVFVTQRGNSSLEPVLVMDAASGQLLHQWGKKCCIGNHGSDGGWGAHGIAVETLPAPMNIDDEYKSTRVYIEDFFDHTVTAYTAASGKQLFQMGTNGTAGNGTSPLQFGNVADAAIISATANSPAVLFLTDGDGGSANRVDRVSVPATADAKPTFVWAGPQIYNNPHSIAHHAKSDLLIVADREDNVTRLIKSSDGTDLGVWSCGIPYGQGGGGKPFGVRTMAVNGLDLLLVAIMDNPQDHRNQVQ
jgi:hypothetical protein